MHRSAVLAATLALSALATPAVASAQPPAPAGQQPPAQAQAQRARNLKVLPADMPLRAVRDTMGYFARALGVRCSHCHVEREGGPNGSTPDFAADDKPQKEVARQMMRMTTAINGEYLARLASRSEPRVVVGCATCHRGLAEPRPLQQVLLSAYERGGVDSVEARYRALRQQYHGRAAYDFGDVPLAEVATALRTRDRTADAIRLYLLNTQFSPTSAPAFRQAGIAQLAAGDTAGAVASLERAVALDANDQQARRTLDALRRDTVRKP